MKTNEFAHLHVHTDASLLDGAGTVDRTVKHAKSLGFEALGITEHGNLTNALLFNETCFEMGIKPIIGIEGYVNQNNNRFHITLLADGNEGFKNLVKLNNIGYENFNNRPTFDISDLTRHNEGVIVLSGCPESPLQKPDYSDAVDTFRYLKKTFGERLFVEMMLVTYGKPFERAIKLHEEFGNDIILTNDVHMAKKEDAVNHRRMLKMKTGGFDYDSKHLYLTTPDELLERVDVEFNRKDLTNYVIQGMSNAGKLANKLGVVKFNSNPKLPHIPNSDKKLLQLIEQGYKDKCENKEITDSIEYRNRLKYEYETIKQLDFSSYFIILHDIVNFAHNQKIWVGKGRGSGAGSLVLFLIGITGIDPIKYNLLFERFLNPKRADMPDVDTDFESEKRDLVIEYANKKWKSTSVATYSTFKHKSLLNDLQKVFSMPKSLTKEAGEFGEDSAQFKQLCETYPEMKTMYEMMHNQIRHVGKHAGGIVINEEGFPLPLIRTTNGQLVSAWTEGTYRELSKVGLVKFDILGLASGSVLRRLKNKLDVEVPEPIDNHEVFTLFQEGNTNGIFQFGGSDGIVQFCKNVKPTSINDLIAINALFRPGPLDSGAAFEYPELKRSGKQRSLHKDIDVFLKETYGVITFQEQVMQIFAYAINADFADADLARKVISKAAPENPSWVKKYQDLQKQFFDGCKERGWSVKDTQKVWDEIKTHSGYSFNKSHSTAYALLAWELAWFKYYYPTDFYCELLNVEKDDNEKVESYMFEFVMNGGFIKNPNINKSTDEYISDSETNTIYLPLTSVKYMSDKTYQKLITKRPFNSVNDFMLRVSKSDVKSQGREGLLALGAFDDLECEGNAYEILQVEDVSKLSVPMIQMKYLGFMLPTKRFLRQKIQAESEGYVVGTVSEIDKRNKGYGDYFVVKMKPEGNFWYVKKGGLSVKEGDLIAVQKKENGQAIDILGVVM